jgi:hypothetical protein
MLNHGMSSAAGTKRSVPTATARTYVAASGRVRATSADAAAYAPAKTGASAR